MNKNTASAGAKGDDDARPGIETRLSQLVQVPTVSAHIGETGPAPFEAFADLLAQLYPSVYRHLALERHDEFGFLFRWAGSNPDLNPLVLMAHYDVVPVGDPHAWSHPPFAGEIADGVVWGRGTLDDKGELCVVLEAVENLVQAGFVPERDIYLSFGGNEETTGESAKAAAAALRRRGIVPWLVLDEGGAVADAPLPFVRGQAAMIGVAEKGTLTVRLVARSAPGHASAPPNSTAPMQLSRALGRIMRRPFPARLNAPSRAMFIELSENATGLSRLLTRALAALPWLTARVFAVAGSEPAALVRTSVAVTMLGGGTAENVLAEEAVATLNLRIAVGQHTAGVVNRLRRIMRDPSIDIEVLQSSDPSPVSASDNEQFALLRAAVDATYPGVPSVPYVQLSATDGRHFHRFSPATYRFAPLAMDVAQRESIHGIDEHVTIDSLLRGERFYRHLISSIPA